MAEPDLSDGGLERDDIQGLVASGYGHLPEACFLLLEIADPRRAAIWLGELAPKVTTARAKSEGTAVNVALAPSGLKKLGLRSRDALSGFSPEFVGGMTSEHRRRLLGDEGESAPEEWSWGAPGAPRVEVVVLLYADGVGSLAALEQGFRDGLEGAGLELVQRLETSSGEREHFGFRDGISQPLVEGIRSGRPADTIKAGEFVLGYRNEYGRYTDRPLVADRAGILPRDHAGSGKGDLGRNGSYLVFRQLSQDVSGFWEFVDRAASDGYGDGDAAARIELAAKIVGRWPDGAPLALAPERDDPALSDANDFGYFHTDREGLGCPLGAHIRRSHPRDSLDPAPGSERSIEVNKRHRILRRGRRYGAPLAPEAALNGSALDDEPRGLHFACLCANIARQFEFVQHTWINSPKFSGLYEDPDPLIGGPGRTLTIQAKPVRRRVTGMPSFVRVRGGGYFFLPGVRALRYLASLAPRGA